MFDQSMELVPVFVEGKASNEDSVESGKYDALAAFVSENPDPHAYNYTKARQLRILCRDLGVTYGPFVVQMGVVKTYFTTTFPKLGKSLPMPKGSQGRGRCFTQKEFAALMRRGLPKRAHAPKPAIMVPPKALAKQGTLTVNINGENVSMSFPICGKQDVEKVTDLLTALTR